MLRVQHYQVIRLMRVQKPVNYCAFHCVCGDFHKQSQLKVFHSTKTIVRSFSGPSLPSDYGKYANPGKLETFYQWLIDTSWIKAFEQYLTTVHDVTGAPWWISILFCTFAIRSLIMTPLLIVQMRSMAKYQQAMSILGKIDAELRSEVKVAKEKFNWSEEMTKMQYLSNMKRHQKNVLEKHQVPGIFRRHLLPWVQIPLWMSLSVAMRDLTMSLSITTPPSAEKLAVATQLSSEGCLWFQNLCLPDAYFILPVIFCIANLSVIEVHRGDGKTPLVGFYKILVFAVRGLSVLLLPVACQMPAGVVLYWTYSSLYGVMQALVLKSRKVKRFFKTPTSRHESKTPYKDILSRFRFRNK